jgi:hypothetical protein
MQGKSELGSISIRLSDGLGKPCPKLVTTATGDPPCPGSSLQPGVRGCNDLG